MAYTTYTADTADTAYTTYTEDGTVYLEALCGCPECDHSQQPGHAYCDTPPADLLEMEAYGHVARRSSTVSGAGISR
jgi:hypothetical protein